MKTFIGGIFSGSFSGLEKALDLTWRRNEAISSNIANAETPGYRAVELSFGKELDKAFGNSAKKLDTTNPGHMDISGNSGAHLIPDLSGVTKADGNNVDLDIQMGRLAYNRSKYAQAANIVRHKFSLLSQAVRQTV